MPRGRKKATRVKARPARKKLVVPSLPGSFLLANPFKWSESYTSLLMGIVVVIVAVLFVVSFVRQTRHIQDTSSTSTTAIPTEVQATIGTTQQKTQTYTVQPGDDLWHIAEKFYKSGYNWVDIAKANNLSDPSMIFSGNVLTIPVVSNIAQTTTQTPSPASIYGLSYTVEKGDDLWTIAVRAYGDGYKWVKIAEANNLANPDYIHAGNVLKLPR